MMWLAIGMMLTLGDRGAAQEQVVAGEQHALLEVRKAQVRLDAERADLERIRRLFNEGLASQTELDRVQAAFDTARLSYEQALLLLIGQHPRLSVREAVKTQEAGGRRFVRLVLRNMTAPIRESEARLLAAPAAGADPLMEELNRRELRDVLVSIRSPGGAPDLPVRGTAVALPYEAPLPVLGPGEQATVSFQLLRDVTSAVVCWTYRGRTQEFDVQLQQAATETVATVSSTQVSQEIELGGTASFDLRLERAGVDVQQFHLRAINLPRAVTATFVNPVTQARVSQISFPSGVTQVSLSLRLTLPDRAEQTLALDQPTPFAVLVMNEAQLRQFADERRYDDDEIRRSRVGAATLAFIPRGVGRVEITAASLFAEIVVRDGFKTSLVLRNSGTRRVDNVRLAADHPANWSVTFEPDILTALDINKEHAVTIGIAPAADVPVGDYEVRIKADCTSDGRRLPSEEKVFRVSVRSRTNVWAIAGLLALMLAVAGAVVIGGARLARR